MQMIELCWKKLLMLDNKLETNKLCESNNNIWLWKNKLVSIF